jgi:hypothetical protein
MLYKILDMPDMSRYAEFFNRPVKYLHLVFIIVVRYARGMTYVLLQSYAEKSKL